jgi:hypothetical protein
MLFEVRERVFEETRNVWSVTEETAAEAVEAVNRGDTLEKHLTEESIISLITQVTHIRTVGEDGEKGEWEPWHQPERVYSPEALRSQIYEWFDSKPSMDEIGNLTNHYAEANELLLRIREEMEADSVDSD